MNCNLCNRKCNIDRTSGFGYCGQGETVRIARASLHMWEEPCISGEEGSGTVFFTGCSLKCVYCQNSKIALGDKGYELSIDELAKTFLELKSKGANNINLVTPTHFVPQIVKALDIAKREGLDIPIVYNTGSYDTVETIKLLDGYVDIYLPDMKYASAELARKYSNAKDYPDVAKKAIAEMVRQVGEPVFDENTGLMKKGVIVRHLVLPGFIGDSKEVIKYLYETYGDNIYISIMNQYTPLPHVKAYPEIDRKLTEEEYDEVVDYAIDFGVVNGFIQEGETASESFIPEF